MGLGLAHLWMIVYPHFHFSAHSPLFACMDLLFQGSILRWAVAVAKAGVHLPHAVLGDRVQTEASPASCSNPSHYMICSG